MKARTTSLVIRKALWHDCAVVALCLVVLSAMAVGFIDRFAKETPVLSQNRAISADVAVSAFVGQGKYHFKLFGFTSPQALVTLDGVGFSYNVYANKTGYFEFANSFMPLHSQEYCLSAQDQLGRLTKPVCLPPFPINRNTDIGPILLPPTISLNKNTYYSDDVAVVSGQSIPNTPIHLSTFLDSAPRVFAIVAPVEAVTFPELETVADEKGNYAISLPSHTSDKFRLFTRTFFLKQLSGDSNNLEFSILPYWMIIIQYLQSLLNLLRPYLLELIIATEVVVGTIALLRHFWAVYTGKKGRYLILLPEESLTLSPTRSIAIYDTESQ